MNDNEYALMGMGWSELARRRKREQCDHGVTVEFDAKVAIGMTSQQVREKYPRAYVECEECGWQGVIYASEAHYYAGDW